MKRVKVSWYVLIPVMAAVFGAGFLTARWTGGRGEEDTGGGKASNPTGAEALKALRAVPGQKGSELPRLPGADPAMGDRTSGDPDEMAGYAAAVGLDEKYVETLKADGLSDNLIVSMEGRIRYGLSETEVRDINQAFRKMLELIKEHDATSVELVSKTDDGVVLKIPPLPEPHNLRQDVEETLKSIAGEETGARIFAENQNTLMRRLMGFGNNTRVISITDLQAPVVQISDKQFDATGSPFTRRWTSPLSEIPGEFRHVLALEE